MKKLHMLSFCLVIIGALNWGLVGAAGLVSAGSNWNVVNLLLGSWPMLENLVYLLVGLAGLSLAFTHKKDCKMCSAGGMGGM